MAKAPPPKPRTGRRWLRVAVLLLTSVTSIAVAGGSIYAIDLYNYVQERLSEGEVQPPSRDHVNYDPGDAVALAGPCDEQACTYLVIGSDSREGLSKEDQAQAGSPDDPRVTGQRSDSILLVHIDGRREKTVVLSFPRDLLVDIPGVGEGKIAASFENGPFRVVSTVKRLTGIEPNHFMAVNLAGFQSVVDSIGGVVMCVDTPMHDPKSGLNLPHSGCWLLDGSHSLAFVRARNVCEDDAAFPDFARITRQQQFLRAILAKALSLPNLLLRAREIAGEVLPNIQHDGITAQDVLSLTSELQGLSTGVVDFRSVPTEIRDVDGDGITDVLPSAEAEQLFARLQNGQPLGNLGIVQPNTDLSPAVVNVRVFDASSGGKAASVRNLLEGAGFDIESDLGTGNLEQPKSFILHAPGKEAEAEAVKRYLVDTPIAEAPKAVKLQVDVAVVITADYHGRGSGVTPSPSPSASGAPPPPPGGVFTPPPPRIFEACPG